MKIKNVCLYTLIIVFVATILTVQPFGVQKAYAASVSNDTTNKTITMSGTNYSLMFNYNNRAVITSLKQNNQELLGNGIYSAVRVGGVWTDSATLSQSPQININGNVVTATFATSKANEVWTFTAYDDRIVYRLSRTYNGTYTIEQQGTPIMDFSKSAIENLRWYGDGCNWPLGGDSAYKSNWMASDSVNIGSDRHDIRATKEQISYTLLNANNSIALSISGASSASTVTRGEATVGERLPDDQFRLYTVLDNGGMSYLKTPESPKGYHGHHSVTKEWLWSSDSVTNNYNVWTEFTFKPESYDNYVNIGTLNGISETALSKMANDYGRLIMVDKAHGALTESPQGTEDLISCEMQWLTQMIDTFQYNKGATVSAFKEGFKDIRDSLQTTDGHIYNCQPGQDNTQSWGRNNPDNQTGYVIGVSNIYNNSGDTTWLQGFKASCEKALDYELSTYCDSVTNLVKTDYSAHAASVHSNDYMEISWWNGQNSNSCIGKPNGYTSAMLYDALRRWAQLERYVLNDSTKANYYDAKADTLKTNYNRNKADGGCWLPDTNSVMLSTTTAEVPFLPALAATMKSDLLKLERRNASAAGYFGELTEHGVNFLVNNVHDLGNAGVLSDYTHLGTDGGLYGAVAGDAYSCFVAANDREKMLTYTNTWLNKPLAQYIDTSYFNRNGDAMETYNCFPDTAALAWGLYYYGFGFQPGYNSLTIAPFIASSMVGSTVKYNFRNTDFQVDYLGLNKFKVTVPSMPANTSSIVIKWVNQTPYGTGYNVNVNGNNYSRNADSDGTVTYTVSSSGTYTLELTNGDSWTRTNDDAASVSYSGMSDNNTLSGYSNLDAHYSDVNGQTSTFTFTGTVIRWIGAKNNAHGVAKVYIDNVFDRSVDTYSPTNLYQQVLYEKKGLTNTTHTIKIEVTNMKNSASAGYYQDIDAFEYTASTLGPVWTRYNDDNSNVVYSGMTDNNSLTGYYNSDAHYSNTNGQSATFTFTGTGIKWIGVANNGHGIAKVYIDNVLDQTVDTYAAAENLFQQELYVKKGLASGTHTIKIEITNVKSPASVGYYQDIDAFEVCN